ncbi:BON domain-containing protein [Bradyrhizobium sp. USDA 4011]
MAASHGVVDLWGFAQSDTARRAIRVAAENRAGVTTVSDHMTVEVTIY